MLRNEYSVGALRSRLVAKLTDLSLRQLGYWHDTGLIEARAAPGAPGHPRLYSWADYLKLREAAKLHASGVHTTEIRKAVDYLEEIDPDWYLLPLRSEGRHVIARIESGLLVGADREGQIRLPALRDPILDGMREIHREGPLGKLLEFDDAVDMNPRIRGGAPVIRRTAIETAFVAELKRRGYDSAEMAGVYQIDELLWRRAVEFERAAA